MTTEQQQIWHKATEDVRQLTDGLGVPVDVDIVHTVAILRLMGFHTTMSCAGHLDRFTGGPYVMFSSPAARHYLMRYRELGDSLNPKSKRLLHKATVLNLRERQRLFVYLAGFYQNRSVSYTQRLIVAGPGFSHNRLQCQGAELAQIADDATKARLLEDGQAEMHAFTEYLKGTYFAMETGSPPE
jgi:hypothetical protein